MNTLLLKKLLNRSLLLGGLMLLSSLSLLRAEGSVDFINYPGMRLFLWPEETHQLKVYAEEGEFVNVGASHVGINGGFISVYRPDGTLHSTFDNTGATANTGIINNDIEEQGGPTGGGTTAGIGYIPGIVPVQAGEAGVWTVMFEFPSYTFGTFTNIPNNAPWTRAANQPTFRRVVLAWDITISKNAAGNEGGILQKGRVYANKIASMVSTNGFSTSPSYYVLTKEGVIYQVNCEEIDPYGFPLHSNTTGIVDNTGFPFYKSFDRAGVEVSNDPSTWVEGKKYLFDPMAHDQGSYINNKIFINSPDPSLPANAMATDVINGVTEDTWLFTTPVDGEVNFIGMNFIGYDPDASIECVENTMLPEHGGFLRFETNVGGTGKLQLDIDGNGNYTDAKDRTIYKALNVGQDSIFWDGMDGLGNPITETFLFDLNYKLDVRSGETHIIMTDVENNNGGVSFIRLNGPNAPSNTFFFDHSEYNGSAVSGGGLPGDPIETETAYTYQSNWGNNKLLDYWTYVDYEGNGEGKITINITDDCTKGPTIDTDGDGIVDIEDIDDDNDGVLDRMEYCDLNSGFTCLPTDIDPSHDEDDDRILNYLDADDPAVGNICDDVDGDGECDQIPAQYDIDGDNVPDHLDLDSDNDGIPDVTEAGIVHLDMDADGVIDGSPADFGLNGYFNTIATDRDAFSAQPNYTRLDTDADAIPDHDDLDSDNDGIHDVAEAGFAFSDTNNDGRIDDGMGNVPTVSTTGLTPIIDPAITADAIPFPPDFDKDLVPDWHDLDSDNDGIHDVREGGNADFDDDAIVGEGTPTVDQNGLITADAVGLPHTTTSILPDVDNDQIPDWHDLDSDNDGINDVREAGFEDTDNDGIIGVGAPVVNVHGIATEDSQMSPLNTTSNVPDKDNDSVPDWHDLDSDNDGINDVIEGGASDPDNDGIIGTGNPIVNTSGQATSSPDGTPLGTTSTLGDFDNDGVPDWHDLDSDNDGINDVLEGGNPDPDNDGIIGEGTPTVNTKGQGTADEMSNPLNPTSDPNDTDGDGIPDYLDIDSDNDGLSDVLEAGFDDPDGDGIVGEGTPEVNDDGQATADGSGNPVDPTSNPIDFDGDGTPDFQDIDSDNDGIDDQIECPNGSNCPDTDNDGMPDWHDLDSDDDGLPDAEECNGGAPCADEDANGTPDFQEYTCSELTTPQLITAITEAAFCEGEAVSLMATNTVMDMPGVSSITYTWEGPNGFSYSEITADTEGPFMTTIPNATPSNEGPYTLTLVTNHECESEPISVTIDISPMPTAPNLDVDADVLCVMDRLELNSTAYSGETVIYSWYFNDGTTNEVIGQTDIPTLFVDEVQSTAEGIYSVAVEVDGCSSVTSNAQDVTVLDVTNLEVASDLFETTFDTPIEFEEGELTLNDNFGTDDNNNFTVQIAEGPMNGTLSQDITGMYTYTPDYHFVGDDQFTYELCSTLCPDICEETIVDITILAREQWGDCFIPNLITPNNDGKNDVLFITCAEANPDNEIMIFNRWGDKVYQTEYYRNDWYGTYQNKNLPAGTYYYIFTVDKNGSQEPVTGYFTILR